MTLRPELRRAARGWRGGARLGAVALVAASAATVAAMPAPAEERLALRPPAGLVELDRDRGADGEIVVRMVPDGETAETWTRMLTVRQVPADRNVAEYANATIRDLARVCPEGRARSLESGEDRGYPFVLFAVECPAMPETGASESFLMKVMGGRVRLYAVRFAWSGAPADRDEATGALRWLKGLRPCDTESDVAPCE